MKTTIQKLTDPQYHYFYYLIVFVLGLSSVATAASFYLLSEMGGGTATASYGSAFFVLGEIATKPLTLTLGLRMGKYKLLKICLWANLIVNIILMFNPVYYIYLVLRFLSGLTLGPVFLIGTSSIGAFGPRRKWLHFYLVLATLMIVVPVLAGAFGAMMAYQYNWRIAFGFFILFNLGLIVFAQNLFDRQETPIEEVKVDYVGLITFIFGISALGFCFITGLEIDGFRSNAFNVVFAIGIIVSTFFIMWNIKQPDPILKWNLFKIPRLVVNFAATFILYVCYFALMTLIALWLHLYVNYSINWIALSFLAIIIGPIFLALVFYNRLKNSTIAVLPISLFILAGVCFYISRFDADVNFGRILITKLIAGVAFAIALPVIMQLLDSYSPSEDYITYSFCTWAMSRVLGTLVGITGFITIWEKRAYFYYQRLGGELTVFSENTKVVLEKLNWFHFTQSMKLEGLNVALNKQSHVLALDDCFYLMTWILLIGGLGISVLFLITRGAKKLVLQTANP